MLVNFEYVATTPLNVGIKEISLVSSQGQYPYLNAEWSGVAKVSNRRFWKDRQTGVSLPALYLSTIPPLPIHLFSYITSSVLLLSKSYPGLRHIYRLFSLLNFSAPSLSPLSPHPYPALLHNVLETYKQYITLSFASSNMVF
jgi:hypothetical protein